MAVEEWGTSGCLFCCGIKERHPWARWKLRRRALIFGIKAGPLSSCPLRLQTEHAYLVERNGSAGAQVPLRSFKAHRDSVCLCGPGWSAVAPS
ncbi:hypothetical protein AAY473_040766 [Plecturocebus cupreus]